MKKIQWPVILVSLFVVFYHFSPLLGFSEAAILSLFVISPIPVLWLAYKILKNGIPSAKTFDEYFYEDYEYKRNVM